MRAEDMEIGKKYRRIASDWDGDIKISTVLTLAEIVSQDSVRFVGFPRMTLMPMFFEPVEEGLRIEDVKVGMKLKRVKNNNPEEWGDNWGVEVGDIVTVQESRIVQGKRSVPGFKAKETSYCYSLADFEIPPWSTHDIYEDVVNHPKHYTSKNGVECIQVTEQFNFNKGNAIKYVWRSGEKNPTKEIEDLEKAKWYLQREIERLLREARPSC